MSQDYIPRSKGGRREWLQHLGNTITTEGPKFGLGAADIAVVTDATSAGIAAMDATVAADAALAAARQAEKDALAATFKLLRDIIGGWKEKNQFLPEHAQALRLVGSNPDFDADNFKPEFKVQIVGGEIRLDWKKKSADAVHVYSRLRGEATWKFLAMDTSSPYIDGRPLAQAGVPEVREYMLRGVVDDAEIGLDSDVKNVTWGGQ